ncbi:hypothetical protein [Rhizobium sp. 007]|uniref:hypothetical protein n=1 Tax=Rhizobium sp. 007 TaxID=2785056 RepID=UPI00188DEB03|nr:hypothetical protein [Rhizobium sp. 007]QPB22306.1 hypothetical protein ISN39_21925 [Rhizobium sp. 007]
MIASILASMEVLDLMTKRYLAEIQNDFEEKLAACELATEAKRKELLNRYGEELKGKCALRGAAAGRNLSFLFVMR